MDCLSVLLIRMLLFVLMSLIFQLSEALRGIVMHFVTLAIDRILSSGEKTTKSQFIATLEHICSLHSVSQLHQLGLSVAFGLRSGLVFILFAVIFIHFLVLVLVLCKMSFLFTYFFIILMSACPILCLRQVLVVGILVLF